MQSIDTTRPVSLAAAPALALIAVLAGNGGQAAAQSSSLYIQPERQVQVAGPGHGLNPGALHDRRRQSRLSPAIAQASFTAVRVPEPRSFAVHDLVTIIIRESTDTSFRASLETERSVRYSGEISDFPRLTPRDLLNFSLRPSSMDQGNPRLGVNYRSDFEGEGDYRRRDSITGRITARVIDVKPNGTLVLEARKYIESDNETLDMVLTGTARVEDIAVDNTVLSSQLFDLRLAKQHTGELRRSTRKGLFTRILDTIFNF